MQSLGEILRKMQARTTSNEPQESSGSDSPPQATCPRCHGQRLVIVKGRRIATGVDSVPIVGCDLCNPRPPIGQSRSFESFKMVPGTEAMIQAAHAFIDGTGPPGLTFIGKNGCGKTHIMEAIANSMRDAGRAPVYIFMPDFLARLRGTFEPESDWRYEDLWSRWANCDVLLLDDVKDDGRPTPWAVEQVERIIETRYNGLRPYVVSTNGTIDSIASVWGRRLADRLFDEFSGAVAVVYNTAPSYRTGRTWE